MTAEPGRTRLEAAFAAARAAGEPALITYVIPGYPSPAETAAVFAAMVEGGARIIEVGIPFSDPLADGATIQMAAHAALEQGMTPRDCLAFAGDMSQRYPETPIVLMSYLNPVLAYGVEAFAADAAAAGVAGLILVDLPAEEAETIEATLRERGIALIFLVAPTSSDARLALITSRATGFVYCVSVAGVTGARRDLPPDLGDFMSRVRRCTNLPLAVGFGMSRRDHVEALIGVADGVVVASAIVDLIARTDRQERAKAVREYVEVLSGRRKAP